MAKGNQSHNEHIVVLCDRGLMDGSAYVTSEEWNALLNDLGDLTTVQIRDNRYDAILHLATAADGAPEFYTTMVDGQARYETAEQAVEKCHKIRTAYFGHHKYSLISNSGQSFKEKINQAVQEVMQVIGYSAGTFFHKKYLLQKYEKNDATAIPIKLSSIDSNFVEEIYVCETFISYGTGLDKSSASVEKQGHKNAFQYVLKTSQMVNKQQIEKKRNISAMEYIKFKQQKKQGTKTLKYKRLVIVDNGLYIKVDYYDTVDGQPMLGIVQLKNGVSEVELPSYIKAVKEVSDNSKYKTKNMA